MLNFQSEGKNSEVKGILGMVKYIRGEGGLYYEVGHPADNGAWVTHIIPWENGQDLWYEVKAKDQVVAEVNSAYLYEAVYFLKDEVYLLPEDENDNND